MLTEQEQIRRDHLDALREAGVDPYPADAWPVTHRAAEVLAAFDDARHQPGDDGEPAPEPFRATVAGRMLTKRVMGKAAFFHLADESGAVQVYVTRDDLPEGEYNTVFKKLLDTGDWLGVEGEVFRTRMGEVSVRAERLVLLAKSLKPLPVEKEAVDEETGETRRFNEVSDPEFRYRQRYADLALHPEVRDVFKARHTITRTLRDFLDKRGYVEVETPALQPLYGGAAARPFTTHHNALDMPLFLRIADELYLKRLLVGGFEGVYEIAKDFRNEGLSRFHNPEFTMLELYVAFRDYDWMMGLVEQMLEAVARALHGSPDVPHTAGGAARTLSFAAPFRRLPSSTPSRRRRATASTTASASPTAPPSKRRPAPSASSPTPRWGPASSSTRCSGRPSSRRSSSPRSSPTTRSSCRRSPSATGRSRAWSSGSS